MAAAWSLLKEKGEEFLDLKSMLLHVTRVMECLNSLFLALWPTLFLLRDRRFLKNLKLSSRDFSVLICLRIRSSVSLDQLQEEVKKVPPVVKEVKVNDGEKFVKTTQINKPSSSNQPKASSSSSLQPIKRSAFSHPDFTGGKKSKVVKGKKQGRCFVVPFVKPFPTGRGKLLYSYSSSFNEGGGGMLSNFL